MAIEKIGGINPNLTPNIYNRVVPKTPVTPKSQPPVTEKPEVTPSGKTEEVAVSKDMTKLKDPPFFPIGDTWSIFDT